VPPAARGATGSQFDPDAPRVVALVTDRRVRVAAAASIDERIDVVMRQQHARASWAQLTAAGIDPSAITRRSRSGRLVRVHPRVYGLPGTDDVSLAAETAALLAAAPDAVLSFHTAVTLLELRPGVARPVHVTVSMRRRGPKLEGVVVHRSRILTPADLGRHHGLPITSPARALLDVAATLPDRDMELLLDEAVYVKKLVTLAEIEELLGRSAGHPGHGRLARVAARYSPHSQTDSPPEDELRALVVQAGLPEAQTRVAILDYRLDFYWPALRLAAEVDAYGTHGSETRFEADRRRDARLLTEAGILVLRFTRAAIRDRPYEVIAQLAQAIARQTAAREGRH
jgi:very-short-patch-repair endonuclease